MRGCICFLGPFWVLRLTLRTNRKQKTENRNGFVERSRKNFVPGPPYRILLMAKKQKSLIIFSVVRPEMAWRDEIRHQFWSVPELAKTGFEPHTGGKMWRAQYSLYISSPLLLCSLGVSDTVSRHIAVARDSNLR